MRDGLVLSLLAVGVFATGVPACIALGVPARRPWMPTLLGLAPLAGLLWCGVWALVLLALGLGAHPLLVVPLAFLGALAGRQVSHRASMTPWPRVDPPGRHSRLAGSLEALVLLAYLPVATALLRVACASSPAWDGWAIWGLKAEALYRDGSLGGPVFLDRFYLGSHQEYPLLQPALSAVSAHALGRFDPALADLPSASAVVLGGLAVWALLRTRMPGVLAAATGLAALAAWPLGVNATDGYADAVLAASVATGVVCAALHVVWRSPAALALACAFLATAGLLKSEGLAFAVAALVALGTAYAIDGRQVRGIAWPGVAVLAPGIAWIVLRGAWVGSDAIDPARLAPGQLGVAGERAATAIGALAGELVGTWAIGLLLALAGAALAVLGRRTAAAAFLAVWVLGSVAALVVVYALAPTDLDWHLTTSADRVVLAIGLTAGVVGPLLAFEGWASLHASGARGSGDERAAPTATTPV